MKYLRKLYESKDSIKQTCRNLGIKNFTINSDGSVDVNGSVNLNDRDLTKIPINFATHNKITNLFGGPKSARSFDCFYNKITSLEGGPTNVPDTYICEHNLLTSLIGALSVFDCERLIYNKNKYIYAEFEKL